MVCKMTWGLIFCLGILRVTCPGDAKATVAAQAEEKRMGRDLGRVKVTCNDTLIVLFFWWNIFERDDDFVERRGQGREQ